MAQFIFPPQTIDTTGLATEAEQQLQTAELIAINAELDSQTALLTTIDADTGSIDTKLTTTNTELSNVNTELDSQTALLTTIDADTGSIDTKLTTTNSELSGVNTELDSQTALLTTIDADTGSIDTKLSDGSQRTQIVNAANVSVSAKDISVQVAAGDIGLVVNSVIHGKTTAGGGSFVDVKVNPSGALTVEATIAGTVPLPTGASTLAEQQSQTALLTTIDADTGSIDTKLSTTNTELGNVNTELDSQTALLTTIDADTGSIDSKLNTLGQKTMANSMPVTLASDQSALPVTGPLTDAELRASAVPVSASSLPLPTGASTLAEQQSQTALLTTIDADTGSIDTKLTTTNSTLGTIDTSLNNIEADIDELNLRLAGSLVPEAYDYIALTYVTVGNGIGEIETVVYKTGGSGGTTVATLTLAYDANDKLASVTRT